MPTADEITTQLREADTGRLLMMVIHIPDLVTALQDGEQIEYVAQAKYSNKTVVAVVTNARLLFFEVPAKGLLASIPYTSLSSVEYKTELHVHHIQPFRTFGYVRGANDHYLAANDLGNLVSLCRYCHKPVECGVIELVLLDSSTDRHE